MLIEQIFSYVLPLAVCLVGVIMLISKKDLFSEFLGGAKEGMGTAIKLAPTLVALIVAIKMLYASGAVEYVASLCAPLFERIGVPSELLPLLLTRPVSGSASMAAYSDLLERYGADSFISVCASVIMGSSDTLVYVIAVYFSSVGIKKSRYAFPAAFLVMLFCIFFSCFICRLLFK